MISNLLFIYGTLLKPGNFYAEYLKKHSRFYGYGLFNGELYALEGYPGAVRSHDPRKWVKGSMIVLNDAEAVFQLLDDYEGYGPLHPAPNEFIREEVSVSVNGEPLVCWTYLYNWPTAGLRLIESGDYLTDR